MNVSRIIVFIFFLFQVTVPSFAADPTVPTQPTANPADLPRGTYMGEAAGAVVGRVFGVEGEASEVKYHAFEFTQHSPTNATVRSFLIPGWGQHFNRQKVKGTIFFFATLGALAGSVHLYNQASESYDEYEDRGKRESPLYDDYERDHTRSVILGSAAAVLWIVNMIDAYRNAYQPLYSKNLNVDVALNDDEAQIILSRNF